MSSEQEVHQLSLESESDVLAATQPETLTEEKPADESNVSEPEAIEEQSKEEPESVEDHPEVEEPVEQVTEEEVIPEPKLNVPSAFPPINTEHEEHAEENVTSEITAPESSSAVEEHPKEEPESVEDQPKDEEPVEQAIEEEVIPEPKLNVPLTFPPVSTEHKEHVEEKVAPEPHAPKSPWADVEEHPKAEEESPVQHSKAEEPVPEQPKTEEVVEAPAKVSQLVEEFNNLSVSTAHEELSTSAPPTSETAAELKVTEDRPAETSAHPSKDDGNSSINSSRKNKDGLVKRIRRNLCAII